jgi:hypothetical protein
LELRQEVLVHLPIPILLPLVLQPGVSLGKILPGGPADMSPGHLQVPLDGHRTVALGEQHDDEVPLAQLGIPCLLRPARKGSTYLPGD